MFEPLLLSTEEVVALVEGHRPEGLLVDFLDHQQHCYMGALDQLQQREHY